MNTKATIRKVLFAMLWISIGGGMLTLLIAAIGKKNRELCNDYMITIKSGLDNISTTCMQDSASCAFIDEKDITRLLTAAVGADLKGRKTAEINLRQLEQLLKDNVWIKDAEMWFDNRNVLQVSVKERSPIARIFTTTGNSFYIDSSGFRMPLSEKMSIRVPVFTDFPEKKIYTAKDSLLLHDVKKMAEFILNDPFWMSQVAQIDINAEGNPMAIGFEMIPVVGNNLVKLGNGNDIDKKFNRLMTFYKEVLSKTGFDVYSTVDVQYAGQVIGTKRGTEKKEVDLAKLRVNVENLLKQMQQMQNDSATASQPITEKPTIDEKQVQENSKSLRATSTQPTNPNAVKTEPLPQKNKNKPKAVMPKKN